MIKNIFLIFIVYTLLLPTRSDILSYLNQYPTCKVSGCGRRNLNDSRFNFKSCSYMEIKNCATVKRPVTKATRDNNVDDLNLWANTVVDWACCELLTSDPIEVRTFISEWQTMCYQNAKLLQRGMYDDKLSVNYNEIVNFCPDSLIATKHNYSTLEDVLERNFNHESEIECRSNPEINPTDEYGSFTVLYSENYTGMGIGHIVGIFNESTDLENNDFINWHMDFKADRSGCRGEHNFENDVTDQYTFFRGGLGTVYSLADYQTQGSFEITAGYVLDNVNISEMKKVWITFQEENGYDMIQSNCAHAVWEVLFTGFNHCKLTKDIASDFMWPHKTYNLIQKLATASKQGKELSNFDLRLINKWLNF